MSDGKKKNLIFSWPTEATKIGPALAQLLEVQRANEELLGDFVSLEQATNAVASCANSLGKPVVWPIGEAAERLSGATLFATKGAVQLRGWGDRLDGDVVLLLGLNEITDTSMQAAAHRARKLGAAQVHACGLYSGENSLEVALGAIDSFREFAIRRPKLAMVS